MPSLFYEKRLVVCSTGNAWSNLAGRSVRQWDTLDQQMTWEWGVGSGESGLNISANCAMGSLLVSLAASAAGGIPDFNRDFTRSATQTTLNC
jgi:hypothetical protein